MEKSYNGKAIYNPSGKAGEYSYWACNFYKGCKGECTYCFLKKGVLKNQLAGNEPKLKECFRDADHAFSVFVREFLKCKPELQKHGLFFSFTSDFCEETTELLTHAIEFCLLNNVPVKVLTKQTDWIKTGWLSRLEGLEKEIAFGFTLTGMDDMEPGCAPNISRIYHLRMLHDLGFLTWVSLEPVISFKKSLSMVDATADFCDLYKIGLESGKKYKKAEIEGFMNMVSRTTRAKVPLYFKDSLLKQAGIKREDLPANCVTRDYNIFKA